jgi:hypothetical protein
MNKEKMTESLLNIREIGENKIKNFVKKKLPSKAIESISEIKNNKRKNDEKIQTNSPEVDKKLVKKPRHEFNK